MVGATTAGYLMVCELNEDCSANQTLSFHTTRPKMLQISHDPITALIVTERWPEAEILIVFGCTNIDLFY